MCSMNLKEASFGDKVLCLGIMGPDREDNFKISNEKVHLEDYQKYLFKTVNFVYIALS